MNILILKPSSLGDVVHALPVLRLLRRHFPSSRISWWIERSNAAILEGDPDLDQLIRFDRRAWKSPSTYPVAWRALQHMRSASYDWVIDLQSLFRSSLVAWLANGALTIGLDDRREGAPLFYDVAVRRPSPNAHAVDWYLSVLDALKVPRNQPFTWLPVKPEAAAAVQKRYQPGNARWILLQPGARWMNKRWPAERFAELVRLLGSENRDLKFGVVGGPGDRPLGETICKALPGRCLNLAGETSLPELIEWIRLGQLLITNDSGPMHIAAALGRPVLALFGPTNPSRTGPYGNGHRVLQAPLPCVPCMSDQCRRNPPLECLWKIDSETAARHARDLLRVSA